MKRKIFAGLMALCMLLCMLPVVSLAASGDLATIDGVAIADGATVNGASLSGSTLTLNGVNAETIWVSASVTNIVVKNNNTLAYASAENAIEAEGNLTVSGTGTLNITGEYAIGIYAEGTVTVDAAYVSINGANYGIYSNDSGVTAAAPVPNPTFIYDFTKPTGKLLEDGSPDIGVFGVTGTLSYDTDLSKGYLHTACTGTDPWICMTNDPQIPGEQMGYMVIKYANKAPLTDQAVVMYGGGDDGLTWGPTGATWRWAKKDGSWDVMTVWDGKEITSDGETFKSVVKWADDKNPLTLFRLDYWDCAFSDASWGGLDLAYIAFFATQADAEAYAAAEEKKLDIEAASGISADKVFTENGVTYTADTVIGLTPNKELTLSGAPKNQSGMQNSFDWISIDEEKHVSVPGNFASTWLISTMNNTLDVTGKSTLAICGWFGEGSKVSRVGYWIGDQAYWTDANPSVSNSAPEGTADKNNPIYYDQALVDALGGQSTARRYYIEIDLSKVPDGKTRLGIMMTVDGTDYRISKPFEKYILLVKNNDFDYSAGSDKYLAKDNDLLINGKDSGLNLVKDDDSKYYAVGGEKVAVTKAANGTYSHNAVSKTGYFVGAAYTVNVKDANGLGYDGATIKLYNEQGNVVARATSKNGVATIYSPGVTNCKFSVEGNFTTLTNLTATNYVVNATVDADLSDITSVTIKNGANVTIIPGEASIVTNGDSMKLSVINATLNADPDTIAAPYDNVTITGASVTVGQLFSLNIYLSHSLNGSKIVVGDDEYTVDYVNGELVAFITGIAPQAIADNMNIQVVDKDGNVQATKDYCVKDNLVNLYNNASSSASLKTLVADLLKYAAAAQAYTGYTANAIDASAYVGSGATATAADSVFNLTESTNSAYGFTGAAVVYDNTNGLYVTVKAAEAGKVTVLVNELPVELKLSEDGVLGVLASNIFANQFADTYTFQLLVDGELVQTLEYSVNTYAYRMGSADNANAALARALYCYGVSAAAYVA